MTSTPGTTLLAILGTLLLVSCSGGPDDVQTDAVPGLDKVADPGSLDRLTRITDGQPILLSLRTYTTDAPPPTLGAGSRELGRHETVRLLEIVPGDLTAAVSQPDLAELVVWGDGEATRRLEPRLRDFVLRTLASAEWREAHLSIIARFDPERAPTPDRLEAELTALGARPRSVVGGVVTLDTGLESLFAILDRSDLTDLSLPSMQQPMQRPSPGALTPGS